LIGTSSCTGKVFENGKSQSSFGNKPAGCQGIILVGSVDSQDSHTVVTELFVNCLHGWHFGAAGWTPTGPKIDNDYLALEIAKRNGAAIEGSKGNLWGRKPLASGSWPILGGWGANKGGQHDPSGSQDQNKRKKPTTVIKKGIHDLMVFAKWASVKGTGR